jgi:NAD(P)-dependent dehydrogenase (short-subunit alcohol dehydrogenase family)
VIADLDGRVTFVTGAGPGIGLATVELLLEQGGTVEATDLRPDGLVGLAEANPERLHVGSLDVTDRVGVRNAVEATADRLGRLDILVCSAGTSLPTIPNAKQMRVPIGTAAWPSTFTA